jgi:hypothetical protein
MCGQVRPGFEQQPHDLLAPPQPGVEDRPPIMLVVGVHECGIGREQVTHRFDVPSPAGVMN